MQRLSLSLFLSVCIIGVGQCYEYEGNSIGTRQSSADAGITSIINLVCLSVFSKSDLVGDVLYALILKSNKRICTCSRAGLDYF